MNTTDSPANRNGDGTTGPGHENDSVASKLSKELSNWRRQRSVARPRHADGIPPSMQTEAARTIKVRGHETLVVRKPKLASKPSNHTPNHQ